MSNGNLPPLRKHLPKRRHNLRTQDTPWWTHWLIAFAVRKTTLDGTAICLLYKYKYREVMPDIDRLQVQHIVADLWLYLRDGKHEYAFEWERSEGYEDALHDLLSVWLFEASRPESWLSQKEGLSWISIEHLNQAAIEEARSDKAVEEAQDSNHHTGSLGQRKLH